MQNSNPWRKSKPGRSVRTLSL